MTYYRLKKQTDFQKLFHSGKRVFTPDLTVIFKPSKRTYFGVSVGKRHGKAVKRNRIKRLLREAFRLTQEEMKGSYQIVFVPKVRDTYSFHAYKKQILCMIKREKL